MSAPLVSFVVPCYNYGRYLRECLDGVLAQEGDFSIEVIAVNDGSTDDTADILASYRDARIRIIDRRVNRGHVFTMNEGLVQSSGKYIVRIDPDDRHHRCFLKKTVPCLEADSSVGLAYGNINLIDQHGRLCLERADRHHGGHDFKGNEFVALLKQNFICAPTVIARREAWMAAWPVPEGLAFNDWYFSLMLARKWDFYYCDHVLADYRVHPENHHTKISRDGSEEKSIFWLLDRVFGEEETDTSLQREKEASKGQIYAAQYRDIGLKYYGSGRHADARRCFAAALRWSPRLWTSPEIVRYLIASAMPQTARVVRALVGRA